MTVTHSTATRQSNGDHTMGLLNAGTTEATGDLQFQNSASAEIATLNLSNPAAGSTNSSGVATFSAITNGTVVLAGTIDRFILRNRDNGTVILGSVTLTAGGGDIELSSTAYIIGEVIQMNSLTYTTAP